MFESLLDRVTIRQLSLIIPALLARTGRVRRLCLSRWTGKGGSYRTVQRFFHMVVPWAALFWLCFRQHLFKPKAVYMLLGIVYDSFALA